MQTSTDEGLYLEEEGMALGWELKGEILIINPFSP